MPVEGRLEYRGWTRGGARTRRDRTEIGAWKTNSLAASVARRPTTGHGTATSATSVEGLSKRTMLAKMGAMVASLVTTHVIATDWINACAAETALAPLMIRSGSSREEASKAEAAARATQKRTVKKATRHATLASSRLHAACSTAASRPSAADMARAADAATSPPRPVASAPTWTPR